MTVEGRFPCTPQNTLGQLSAVHWDMVGGNRRIRASLGIGLGLKAFISRHQYCPGRSLIVTRAALRRCLLAGNHSGGTRKCYR